MEGKVLKGLSGENGGLSGENGGQLHVAKSLEAIIGKPCLLVGLILSTEYLIYLGESGVMVGQVETLTYVPGGGPMFFIPFFHL